MSNQSEDDYDSPVVWAGHDPMAWAAAVLGAVLIGMLAGAAVITWGVVAVIMVVWILVAVTLGVIWRRFLKHQP